MYDFAHHCLTQGLANHSSKNSYLMNRVTKPRQWAVGTTSEPRPTCYLAPPLNRLKTAAVQSLQRASHMLLREGSNRDTILPNDRSPKSEESSLAFP